MRMPTYLAGAALLASCVSPAPAPVPPGRTMALERACLDSPLDPQAWDALAAALREGGELDRAAAMARQADTLRSHDLRRDLALLAAARRGQEAAQAPLATLPAGQTAAEGPQAAPSAAPRIELRRIGAAMVELRYAQEPAPLPGSQPSLQPVPQSVMRDAAPPALRLEISNGNGVTGMAARLGRELAGGPWKTVRLSNLRPYTEPRSRIEYGPRQQEAAQLLARSLKVVRTVARDDYRVADVRVVLGHDMRK
ncbi:LytR C-terminal domain-containing protein [Oxalobacteraceae bacterium A2-2]